MECKEYDIEDLLNNKRNETEDSKEKEIKYYDNILKIIENNFISENYNTSDIDNGKDEIIKHDKITITLTTLDNQKK